MIKKDMIVWVIVLVLACAVIVVSYKKDYERTTTSTSTPVSTLTPATSTSSQTPTPTTSTPSGSVTSSNPTSTQQVTMTLYRSTKIENATVIPWAVTQDSRCPLDAICIQAGKVTVALKITEAGEEGTIAEVTINDKVRAGGKTLMLREVQPYPISTRKTQDSEYRFIFDIL